MHRELHRELNRGIVAVALLATASCHTTDTTSSAPELRIGFGIAGTARKEGVASLTDLFYTESLLRREWNGRITPRLAADFRWEDGGKVLLLHLRQPVFLHDGTPLNSEGVTQQLRRLIPAPGKAGGWGFQYVTAIEAPDPATVAIRVTQPDLFLLTALSDIKIVQPGKPDVGTGPFRLVSRGPDVIAERFDRYHGGLSPLGGVRIKTYDTQRSAWAALMRGEVDVVQEVGRESVEFLKGSASVRTYSSLQPFYIPLGFNQRHEILRHAEVRRALSAALDREEIVEKALRGRGMVADAPVWPYHWAYQAPSERRAYNPERARRELDLAGYPLPADGTAGEFRRRFGLKCLVYSEDPQYERVALLVQRQLFDVGVDLQIELMPLEQIGERLSLGDFETYLLPANASRTLERTYRFWRSPGPPNPVPMQDTGYAGADDLLDRLRGSTSEEETKRVVSALTERFNQDVPAIFIAWLDVTRAVDARFETGGNPDEDPLYNVWQWRLADPSRRLADAKR